MTQRQVNEVERIRTRYGVVRTRETECVALVYVHGDGGSSVATLVIALDQEGRTVGSRKVRRIKITEAEIEEAMA